jgi:MFS family permease
VFAKEKHLGPTLENYTLAILNAASVVGRVSPNFLADYFGPLNLLTIMCTGSGILCFAVFGADTQAGLVCVAIFFGFFQGAYVSLVSPALIATAKGFHEIGIRIGLGFLLTSFSTLTGTPITGALLDKYGFYAPIVWSGVTVLSGSALLAASRWFQAKDKGTWKV